MFSRSVLVVAVFGVAACACGGVAASTTSTEPPGASDGGADAPPTGDGGARVPVKHRPTSVTCAPAPLPPEPVIPDAGVGPSATFACRTHADCTAKPRGRCIFFQTSPPIEAGGTRCLYDECTTDSACPPAQTCTCNALANTCTPGICRVDADCAGGKGFCSPSVDGCGTFNGYVCHTLADTCTDDEDCGQGLMRCVPDTTTLVWSCRPVGCASGG
jgi:hypothetical protein